jgi:glutathione S-transferase
MSMADLRLYYHPFSRAATVVWMLEEVGEPYDVEFVDLMKGEHKRPELVALNAMGKIPILVDGDAAISETAAIGMYLADRYRPGELAPTITDPARGAYLRWCVFSPSVIEPSCMAHSAGWTFNAGSAGFGNHDTMLDTLERGIGEGPWLLGERFTMADVIVGATLMYMLQFKMIEDRPRFVAYTERLSARPAAVAAQRYNDDARAQLSSED